MVPKSKTNRGLYLDLALDDELRMAAARERMSISRFVSRAIRNEIAAAQKRRSATGDVAA